MANPDGEVMIRDDEIMPLNVHVKPLGGPAFSLEMERAAGIIDVKESIRDEKGK